MKKFEIGKSRRAENSKIHFFQGHERDPRDHHPDLLVQDGGEGDGPGVGGHRHGVVGVDLPQPVAALEVRSPVPLHGDYPHLRLPLLPRLEIQPESTVEVEEIIQLVR